MRKSFACLFLVAVSWVALSCAPAFAAPTTTAAATSNTGFMLTPDPACPAPPTPPTAACTKWTTVLTTTIKNPTADDDLFIDVAQVDALTTDNSASSASPALVSIGDAKLEMRVLVDGVPATPGPIIFDEQLTQLSATLQAFQTLNCSQTPTPEQIVTLSCVCFPTATGFPAVSCSGTDPVPVGFSRTCTTLTAIDHDVVTSCTLSSTGNQTLSTLLSETLGHSYDFFAKGIEGSGDTHIVQVQERLHLTNATGSAEATIGPTTLKIQAVNLK